MATIVLSAVLFGVFLLVAGLVYQLMSSRKSIATLEHKYHKLQRDHEDVVDTLFSEHYDIVDDLRRRHDDIYSAGYEAGLRAAQEEMSYANGKFSRQRAINNTLFSLLERELAPQRISALRKEVLDAVDGKQASPAREPVLTDDYYEYVP